MASVHARLSMKVSPNATRGAKVTVSSPDGATDTWLHCHVMTESLTEAQEEAASIRC